MSEEKTLAAYVASYNDPEDALADYGAFMELGKKDIVHSYDIALVIKDDKGKLHIKKKESTVRMGTEIGLLAGVLVGVIIPPVFLIEAAGGAVAGGLIGHFSRGLHRKDAEDLGQTLSAGQAGIVIVGISEIDDQVERVFARASSVRTCVFNVHSRHLEDLPSSFSSATLDTAVVSSEEGVSRNLSVSEPPSQ